MTQYDFRSIARNWKEFWGRRKIMPPIPFTETSIVTESSAFRVGAAGHYLPLPQNTAGIITSPTGQKQIIVEGGFFELEEGAYTIQYIDLSERSYTFSRINASTTDGFEVSLTISITYKINDPAQTIPVSSPLQTLFTVCTGAAKNYISTHRHDELIGEKENEAYIPDAHVTQHIREKIAFNQVCSRAFWLIDIVIVERHGSLEINRKKQERIVQEKQSLTQREKIIQQQGIAEEQKILEKTKAAQDSMVIEMKALAEANKSEIIKHARILDIELETMRKQPDMQQEQIKMLIDAKKQALETLLHLYTVSGFPRDANDLGLMEKILGSLSETQIVIPEISSDRSKSVNDLSSTIINLITPKNDE